MQQRDSIKKEVEEKAEKGEVGPGILIPILGTLRQWPMHHSIRQQIIGISFETSIQQLFISE